jgi:hypothetical protein
MRQFSIGSRINDLAVGHLGNSLTVVNSSTFKLDTGLLSEIEEEKNGAR